MSTCETGIHESLGGIADEAYPRVKTYGTEALGPLTFKQFEQRSRFFQATEVLGIVVDPDTISDEERQDIFNQRNILKVGISPKKARAALKNTPAEKDKVWTEKQEINRVLGLDDATLAEKDVFYLRCIRSGLTSTKYNRRVKARRQLERIKKIKPDAPASKATLKYLQNAVNFLQLGLNPAHLNIAERKEVLQMEVDARKNKEKKVSRSSNGKKKSKPAQRELKEASEDTPVVHPRTLSMPSESYAYTRANPLRKARRNEHRVRKAEKMLKRQEAFQEKEIIQHPNTVSISRLCPNPYKRTYATRGLAEDFIMEVYPDDPYLKPYRCKCGALHIGHG